MGNRVRLRKNFYRDKASKNISDLAKKWLAHYETTYLVSLIES